MGKFQHLTRSSGTYIEQDTNSGSIEREGSGFVASIRLTTFSSSRYMKDEPAHLTPAASACVISGPGKPSSAVGGLSAPAGGLLRQSGLSQDGQRIRPTVAQRARDRGPGGGHQISGEHFAGDQRAGRAGA